MKIVLSSEKNDSFGSSFPIIYICFFIIEVARTSNAVVKGSGS